MLIFNRRRRVERKLALAALILSGWLALDGANAIAITAIAQKSSSESSSKNRSDSQSQQSDDSLRTRPRRVDREAQNETADGPIIRIGIMTDVTSIALSSSSDLFIRSATSDIREEQKTASAPLRIEVRQSAAALRESGYTSKAASQSRSTAASDRASNTLSNRRAPQVVAIESERLLASSEDSLIINAAPDLPVRVAGKEYRGEIHLVLNRRGKINVVNALPLEHYLRGVVPMELPPGRGIL